MNTLYNPPKSSWAKLCERPSIETKELESVVKEIFSEVKKKSNKALKDYTLQFDKVEIESLKVTSEELKEADLLIGVELKSAIKVAIHNVQKFHSAQKLNKQVIETSPGVQCWQEERPIEKIGLYIPGGSAPLFSTIIMLAVPAQIAGCKEIVLCTPPNKSGNIHPAILYTALQTGVKNIYKVGGAQAIAAMTYGTQSIPQVYKIFGPGNQYVTAAKQLAQQLGIAIDMPAGPSELLVYADQTANPAFVASDLLSQAEHGSDSQVICVVSNKEIAKRIQSEVLIQLQSLPRKAIAEKALSSSHFMVISDLQKSIEFVNKYAPEHLIICSRQEDLFIEKVMNAGSVFLGNYSPESAGDYASGTNHTLPTSGFAKNYSGLTLEAFTKKISFQKLTRDGINNLGPAIEIMADAEGLQAHKNAVSLRLKKQ